MRPSKTGLAVKIASNLPLEGRPGPLAPQHHPECACRGKDRRLVRGQDQRPDTQLALIAIIQRRNFEAHLLPAILSQIERILGHIALAV